MNGWESDFQELLCGFGANGSQTHNQQLLNILCRYLPLHQEYETQAFMITDNILRQPHYSIHFCSPHLSALFPGRNGEQKCWVSMIISDSESIRSRLGRLHSFSQTLTIDLTSNHVIRHTVLSLYLLGASLINISHNAGALNSAVRHEKTEIRTRDTGYMIYINIHMHTCGEINW